MRVNRLEMTAFGPFATTETIDFAPLNDAGIFLLTGNTGAGKTTILDAICFGLFGAVPGPRNGAKDLRSHHAADDTAPTVVLDVTLRGRRFRTRRSPAWTRPSRRAKSGRSDQAAKASIEELIDGSWVMRSNRIDEVGQLVTRVLGMTREQFCQVVMLPQGTFQTFLRAGAHERHDVLESLFQTQRFSRIEGWLGERRRQLDSTLQARHREICQLLARAKEAGGDTDYELEGPSDPDLIPACRRALGVILDDTTTAAFDARQVDAAALVDLKESQHHLDAARDLRAQQQRHQQALEQMRDLEAIRDVVAERADRVRRAEGARAFTPLLDLVAESESRLAAARDQVTVRLAGCPPSVAARKELRSSDVDAVLARQRETLPRLEAMVQTEQRAAGLTADLEDLDRQLDDLTRQLDTSREAAENVPELIGQARLELREATDLAATRPALQAQLADAETAEKAAHAILELTAEATELTLRREASQRRHDDARSHWLDLRELRLHGMAAELAGQLRQGDACLVCGSISHPAPAVASGSPVTAADEAVAATQVQVEEADLRRLTADETRVRARLAHAETLAGGLDLAAAQALTEICRRRVEAATQARQEARVLTRQINELEAHHQHAQRSHRDLEVQTALLRQQQATWRAELGAVNDELLATLGTGVSAADTLTTLRSELAATAALAQGVHELERRSREAEGARAKLVTALAATDFSTVESLRAAWMAEADVAVADAQNRAYEAELHAAARAVEDEVLRAAAAQPEPDLHALVGRVDRADEVRQHTAHRSASLARRRERLAELLDQLDDALHAWEPLLAERDLAASVAALCAGTAADNLTKTKLSHYVLAARLEQVVAAANLRLSGVCGGRYQLEHSMDRGVGDARGGLGLLVLDTYTGRRRDPATLSGGETFYVSLALALGLADLVQQEVGNAELATLFVDEGFGTLDSETLDEVMDEIDSLRSAGRCVGLVSHLSELRMRIPAQIHVRATPTGSTVALP